MRATSRSTADAENALFERPKYEAIPIARDRIRVNSILPGWIETDMTKRAFGDERFAAAVMPRIPARRWGTIDDFGGIAVYLASDASKYHTGDTFVIDGGYLVF